MTAREIVLHRAFYTGETGRYFDWHQCIGGKLCNEDEHLVVVPKDALKEARIEALEEAKEVLWERVGREEYGHAKAAVTLDIEAVDDLLARERKGETEQKGETP